MNKIYKIILSGMHINTFIGVLDEEKLLQQLIKIDATLEFVKEIHDDNICNTLDYRILRNIILEESTKYHINLIETLAKNIIDRLLYEFETINFISIKISKPMAFKDCENISIEVDYHK